MADATTPPARQMPEDPSERTLDELLVESSRLEAATLYLQEWAAAVQMRAATLHGLTRAMIERQRVAVTG